VSRAVIPSMIVASYQHHIINHNIILITYQLLNKYENGGMVPWMSYGCVASYLGDSRSLYKISVWSEKMRSSIWF